MVCLPFGKDDFREVCHCLSGGLLLLLPLLWSRSFPRADTTTHVSSPAHTHTHTQRRIGRGTEEPHTADAALLRDSIQGICTVTSKHALCHGPPRKTCLPCRPLRVMCSQSRRSECNYSASQWAPFICPLWPGDTRK